jgi:hypothetical protein
MIIIMAITGIMPVSTTIIMSVSIDHHNDYQSALIPRIAPSS